jgi:hypothetical protein
VARTETPPPGEVHELAERAVEYVKRALGMLLDYAPETLPLLDHYLDQVPRDQPDTVALVAAAAGAYFGEVARRTLGGDWEGAGLGRGDPPSAWKVRLSGGVSFSPVGFAAETILEAPVEGYDGGFDVPPADRQALEEALADKEVPEDEYYSLSGRLEALEYVVEVCVARQAEGSATRS